MCSHTEAGNIVILSVLHTINTNYITMRDCLAILYHCIQLEGSLPSLFSFCIYGEHGFFPLGVRAKYILGLTALRLKGPGYNKPGLQAEKNELTINTKRI